MVLPFSAPKVAVVEMYGAIGRNIRPDSHLPLLERVRRSRHCRALVLTVDSPGGSAALSEELYLALRKVAKEKPVVAYVRGMAASGGLYISAAAHKVVAIRTALVGSIGVIMARLNVEQLLHRAGVSFTINKSGAYKDMFSPWRAPSPEEVQKLQVLTDEVFERFIEVVAEGRHLPIERVRAMATGEIFTAANAKDLGLVDELGDMDRAVEVAAEMAHIKPQVAYLRPARPLLPWTRQGVGQEIASCLVGEVEALMTGRLHM